ncbi:MAG: Tol-Pal system beta propeller repeat protein TolB [Chlorobium sp.]|nr:Tol-Pal system beta propeller repeat protein TolB [Chlorobium sp.]
MAQLFNRVVPGIFFAFFCLVILPLNLSAAETGEYIAIRKEGSGNIALVLDKLDAKGTKESRFAQSLDTIMYDGLDFTKLFALISPPLNVRDYSDKKNVVINFGALTSVGAEVYAGGSLTRKSGMINLDMKVYDASGSKLLLSKTYTGREEGLRSIGHAFCADLVELLTGKKSVFGSKIVFVSNKNGFKEVYECDFDGYGVQQLTNAKSIAMNPTLSPDGRSLAYISFAPGRPTLYIRDLAGGTIASVGKSGVSIDPGWRNNSEVAATLSLDGNQAIYLVKTDGSFSKRVTNNKSIDISPAFSPDGTRMAFVSSRNGLPQIFIQDIQSGLVKRLTFSGRYNTQPSWSPLGDKIAYTTWEKNGEINIFVINTDGSGLLQLTQNNGENKSPSWSPDGEMIVYTSNRQGKEKMYVMSSKGGNERLLLQSDDLQTQPSWSLFR